MHTLYITVQAKKDIAFLKKNTGKAVTKKIEKLLLELIEHPKTGAGQVEQLTSRTIKRRKARSMVKTDRQKESADLHY